MKALLLFLLATPFFSISVDTDGKEIFQQYYKFESACYLFYTIDKSTVLSFNTDSSFVLEMFSIKRGQESLYTKSEFTGKWSHRNDTIFLKYLKQEINSISKEDEKLFYPNQVLIKHVPTYCVISGDLLLTNSIWLDICSFSKNKAFALSAKLEYEVALKKAGNNMNSTFKLN